LDKNAQTQIARYAKHLDLSKVKKKGRRIEIPIKKPAKLQKQKGKTITKFHGSINNNIPSILNDRLRIYGGMNAAPNGSVYGKGIYVGDEWIAKRYGTHYKWPYKTFFRCSVRKSGSQDVNSSRGSIHLVQKEEDVQVKCLILEK